MTRSESGPLCPLSHVGHVTNHLGDDGRSDGTELCPAGALGLGEDVEPGASHQPQTQSAVPRPQPPSITISCPVMYSEAGDARKRASALMSSG